ncbi:MAG: hypothetical protein U9N77_15730, partial [Thermodesulfobacteriota bacterium]|nr:hypothetical protein [Thermodesulfobacteriota bacterium]
MTMRIQKLITLLALFVILLVLSTPWLLNTGYVKTEIIEFISHKTHKKIEFNTIKLALFPKPCLKIDKISIPLPQDKNLTIGQVQIYPDMYDLIKGDINIKKISIKESLIFLAHTGKKTAPFPFPHFSIFNNLPAAQKDCLIVIEKLSSSIFKRVNGSIVVSPGKKEISGKILIKNITMDDPEKRGLTFGEKIKSCSGDQLTAIFKYKNPGEIDLHITGKSLRLTAQNKEKIQGTNFSVKISVTKKRTMVILEPFILDPPLMNISINFLKDKDKNKIKLSFNGKKINIDETKKTAMTLFPNNEICKTIFDILPKGNISGLVVSFSGTAMDNLFDAKKMVIKGSIDHGRVNIPETLLVVNDFNGDVIVKNGILHTKVSNGIVEKTVINNGTIGVDLLKSSYDFNGRFNLFANLENLPHVLTDLLPDTKLAEELKLCHDIYGNADAVLILKKNKNNLDVSVKAKDISLKGEYQRIPGEISINRGIFSYNRHGRSMVTASATTKNESHLLPNSWKDFHINDNFVILDKLDGYINKSRFHDLSASITLDGEHLLNITSGKALIDMETFFPWLVSFKKIDQMLSPLKSVKGKILLDAINIKGQILKPGKLQYNRHGRSVVFASATTNNESHLISNSRKDFHINRHDRSMVTASSTTNNESHLIPNSWKDFQINLSGSCQDLVLSSNSLKNEISALSCRFSITNKKTTISDICADISDTGILTSLTKVPLMNSLSMPLSISKAIFRLNKTKTVHSQFTDCKHLQGAADAGLLAHRRTHVLQVPDNTKCMPCESLHKTASFKGRLLFKKGPELFIDITDNSGLYTINRLKINKREESNGLLLIKNDTKDFSLQPSSKPFFKIKGKIDTRTLEKIVKPDSPAFKKIRSLTHGNNYLIESDKESNITISTDYIDINQIMQNLYNRHDRSM